MAEIRKWFDSKVDRAVKGVERTIDKQPMVSELRNNWMGLVYVVAILLITAGLVNAVLQPVDEAYIIYPASGFQSGTETAIDALALLIGAAGIYLSCMSGRQTTKPRVGNFYLTVGLMLMGIALYIGIYVLSSK